MAHTLSSSTLSGPVFPVKSLSQQCNPHSLGCSWDIVCSSAHLHLKVYLSTTICFPHEEIYHFLSE